MRRRRNLSPEPPGNWTRSFPILAETLDADSPGMEFSLRNFCRNIYRTSELMGDEVVQELVNERT